MTRTGIITPDEQGGYTPSYSSQIAAPGPYVRNGDFLRLNASSTDASATLVLNGRLLRPDREIVPLNLSMTITGTGNQTAVAMPLVEGWIVGFIVFVSAGTITDGEIVASVDVVQGSGTGLTRVMCLASGEVTNTRSLGLGAFTYSTPTASTVATPALFTGSDPALGAQGVITVPAATTWHVLSFSYTLQNGPTVAARNIRAVAKSGSAILNASYGLNGWSANQLVFCSFAGSQAHTDCSATGGGVYSMQAFPPVVLTAGCTLNTDVNNIQADDQISNVRATGFSYAA